MSQSDFKKTGRSAAGALLVVGYLLFAATAAGARDLQAPFAVGPIMTAPPTISGTANVGATISASSGIWGGSGAIDYSYAWQTCDAQGADCLPLPYTTQTIQNLAARVGGTIRVEVTATDTTGSATATSAAVTVLAGPARGSASISFLTPTTGATRLGGSVKLVVRVTSKLTVAAVSLTGSSAPERHASFPLKRGSNGSWSITLKPRADNGPRQTVTVTARLGDGSQATKSSWFRFYTAYGLTWPGLADASTVLGCNPCSFNDKRGDAVGNGPDITRVRAAAKAERVTVTITTANSWSSGTVCAFFAAPPFTAAAGKGSIDCYGPKINNGGLDGDRPALLAHPNAHTTVVSFSLASIRPAPYRVVNAPYLLIGTWSHGGGDFQYDSFPNKRSPDSNGQMIKLQLARVKH